MGKKHKLFVAESFSNEEIPKEKLTASLTESRSHDEVVQKSLKKKKRKLNSEFACDGNETPTSELLTAESVQKSSKEKKMKSNAEHAFECNGTPASELFTSESDRSSSKKKKRKFITEESGCSGVEDLTSQETAHENGFVQCSAKKKKRNRVKSTVDEENGAFGGDDLTSNEKHEDSASSLVAKNHEGATNCENGEDVRKAAGISVTKQPAGKYVVGSLARLFSGTSVTLPTEDPGTAVTVMEGQTVIRPRKCKKDISDNTTQSKESEVEPEMAARGRDRIQQRENKKRARESLMSLEEKKRTIFVGNAPLTMNEKSCKKLFSQYGKIESVRMRCIFPSKETVAKRIAHLSKSFHKKQTSIIFYVKFKDEESVQKALAYNGTILDRHRIRVDTCTSKAQYDRKLTVFVGNIPLDAREDDLATLFEDTFGDVSFVRCVKDQSTGMGKGFAFVVFKSPASVPLALSTTGLQFQKRELRIMKVMKKNEIPKLQSTRKDGEAAPSLTKEQSTKVDQYKFSTRKSQNAKHPPLKKKARKAIQRKKSGNQVKSFMH